MTATNRRQSTDPSTSGSDDLKSDQSIFRGPKSDDDESGLGQARIGTIASVSAPFQPGMSGTDLRRANRALRVQVSRDEYTSLMTARNELAHASVTRDLTRQERLKLNRLEWELQAIEAALHGPHLDALEFIVEMQESLARELKKVTRPGRKPRKRKK